MTDIQGVLSDVLAELKRAEVLVRRYKAQRITSEDDRDLLKSIAYAWFRTHRPNLRPGAGPDLEGVDTLFRTILEATDRATRTTTYLAAIKSTTAQVRALRSLYLVPAAVAITSEASPDFTPLAADPVMRSILVGRWEECQRCQRVNAHLAATVMMGGLLEALFVARANALPNKAPLFKAKATPLDAKTNKPLQLKEWTLRPYIDVGYELGWITKAGKDVAVVLRDYRNLVHPEKQRSLGVELNEHDSRMFWEVTKGLSRQLLASI